MDETFEWKCAAIARPQGWLSLQKQIERTAVVWKSIDYFNRLTPLQSMFESQHQSINTTAVSWCVKTRRVMKVCRTLFGTGAYTASNIMPCTEIVVWPCETNVVAVVKDISGDVVVVRHVPRSTSPICSIFIRQGKFITRRINGHRPYSGLTARWPWDTLCVIVFSFDTGLKYFKIDTFVMPRTAKVFSWDLTCEFKSRIKIGEVNINFDEFLIFRQIH